MIYKYRIYIRFMNEVLKRKIYNGCIKILCFSIGVRNFFRFRNCVANAIISRITGSIFLSLYEMEILVPVIENLDMPSPISRILLILSFLSSLRLLSFPFKLELSPLLLSLLMLPLFLYLSF